MHDISKKITHFFIQLNFIDESSEVWCQYVVEKKVMQALFLIITFIVAFLYNQIFETLIFCVVFCSIRERMGGWHAPYPWLCLVLSGLIISLVAGVLVPITLNIGLFDIFLCSAFLSYIGSALPSSSTAVSSSQSLPTALSMLLSESVPRFFRL